MLLCAPSGFTAPNAGLRSRAIRMQAVEDAAVVAPAAPPAAEPAAAAPDEIAYPTAMLEALGGAAPAKHQHTMLWADPLRLPTHCAAGYDVETGGGIWDPLKLAAQPEVDLKWYRQAEIKHGRVAMLACVGYVAAKTGTVFQGDISLDGTQFADIVNTNPFLEWDAVPFGGKLQALIAAAVIELNAEQKSIDGGKIGEMPVLKAWLPWIPQGEAKDPVAKAKREKSLLSELKNGRLAMIGIASFYAAETIPGSVPFHF